MQKVGNATAASFLLGAERSKLARHVRPSMSELSFISALYLHQLCFVLIILFLLTVHYFWKSKLPDLQMPCSNC